MKIERKMSKWTGLFCLFSADLWKFEKDIEKLYRSDAISEEKEGKKAGKTSVKFENLEEKMSKWTGLNKQTKNLSKFEGKKKLSFGFREEKQGKTVKIREKLEKLEKKKTKKTQ